VSGAPAEPPLATRRLHLKPGRERSVLQGHPWLFSGAVAREDGPEDAPLALVLAADGAPLALGFHNPRSQIRARLAAAPGTPIDGAFFRDRIAAAVRRRHELLPPETDGFRLINAEGDDLPGWTVDRFGSTLVSEITAAGLDRLAEIAYGALAAEVPEAAILHLGAAAGRGEEGLATAPSSRAGRRPASPATSARTGAWRSGWPQAGRSSTCSPTAALSRSTPCAAARPG
jgi:23S rRNA (cytosine1962-C5)-methyltransferase